MHPSRFEVAGKGFPVEDLILGETTAVEGRGDEREIERGLHFNLARLIAMRNRGIVVCSGFTVGCRISTPSSVVPRTT